MSDVYGLVNIIWWLVNHTYLLALNEIKNLTSNTCHSMIKVDD